MPNYLVISDEYGEVIPVLDYGQGPTEYGRDICLVIGAKDKNEAKWVAVKHWRREGANCLDDSYNHPLKGVKVELFAEESAYPITWADGDTSTWEETLKDYGHDLVIMENA